MDILEGVKINQSLTFYVECKDNSSVKYSNRLHFVPNENGSITIDIDKGSDGGTWSKNVTKAFISEFFGDIYGFLENPASNNFTYEQW